MEKLKVFLTDLQAVDLFLDMTTCPKRYRPQVLMIRMLVLGLLAFVDADIADKLDEEQYG